MEYANKLSFAASEHILEIILWKDQKLLVQFQTVLASNFIEKFFPLFAKVTVSPHFMWNKLFAIYWLNGPGRFAALRCQVTVIKLLATFQPLQIYVLNHLLFQTISPKLTNSLITANKKSYYYGQFKNFVAVQPFKLINKTDLKLIATDFSTTVVDFAKLATIKHWQQHWLHFHHVDKCENLQPFFLNPFSIDKITK